MSAIAKTPPPGPIPQAQAQAPQAQTQKRRKKTLRGTTPRLAPPALLGSDPVSWEEPLTDYLRWMTGSRKPGTVRDAKSHLGQVQVWAQAQTEHGPHGLTLDRFKAKHLAQYLAERAEKGVADVTRRSDAVTTKAFLKFCVREDYLRSDPLQGYIIPKAEAAARIVPPTEDIAKLLQAIPDSWNVHKNPEARFCYERGRRFYAARDTAIVTGLIATGARISEMMGLHLADWRPDKNEIAFRTTKNGHPRFLPVSPFWAEAVSKYLRYRPTANNPFLFVNADGGSFDSEGQPRPIPITSWFKAWDRYMAFAGLSGWSRHHLRHYHATYIAVQCRDLMTASAMLGHKDLKTTKIYTHNSAEMLQEAFAKSDPLANILVNTRSVKERNGRSRKSQLER